MAKPEGDTTATSKPDQERPSEQAAEAELRADDDQSSSGHSADATAEPLDVEFSTVEDPNWPKGEAGVSWATALSMSIVAALVGGAFGIGFHVWREDGSVSPPLSGELDQLRSQIAAMDQTPNAVVLGERIDALNAALEDLQDGQAAIANGASTDPGARTMAAEAQNMAREALDRPTASPRDLRDLATRITALEARMLELTEAVDQLATAPREVSSGPSTPPEAFNAFAQMAAVARSGEPFAAELARFRPYVAESEALNRLSVLAEDGAPSTSELARQLDALMTNRGADEDLDGEGLGQRLMHVLTSGVSIETEPTSDNSANDAIERAQLALREGDAASALAHMQSLNAEARENASRWIDAATKRVEIERYLNELRDQLT